MDGTEFARISGSYSTAFVGTYEVLRQSTSNNSTTFRLYGYFYYGGGTSVGSSSSNFELDGTTVKTGSYRYYPGTTLLGTKDITVSHNNDGSFPDRSVSISASSYHLSGSASGNLSAGNINRRATVTGATDFNDEGNPTITFNNPGSFRINARLEFAGTSIRRDNIANTGSYTFNLTDDERKLLRQKCTGNSMIVREVIATCTSGTTESLWSYQDKTMTIVNANPTFSNFNFEDTNSTTVALTGNNQNIINGYSNVKVSIPVANKAEALKEAQMSKYRFTCGDKSTDINYSSEAEVNGTINGVPNGTFTVYATDSRNNSTSVQKLANQVINYNPLTKGNISIGRNNGVSESVTLSFNGTIDVRNFGEVTNSIKSAKFRFKIANSSNDWTEKDLTVSVSGSSFSFNGLVEGDTEAKGFNVSNSYQIEVIVKDELSSVTFTDKFGSGTPNIAFHKNGVGIMGKYDKEVGGLLQAGGKRIDSNLIKEFTCTSATSKITFDNLDIVKDGGIYELVIFGRTTEGCMVLNEFNGLWDDNHYTSERIVAANSSITPSDYIGVYRAKNFARADTNEFSARSTIIYNPVSEHAVWMSQSFSNSESTNYLDIFGGYCNITISGISNITKIDLIPYIDSGATTFKPGTVAKLYRK